MIDRFRVFQQKVKNVVRALTKEQRRTYLVSLLFMVVNSTLEVLTLGMLVPFIGVAVSPAALRQYAANHRFLEPLLSISTPTLIVVIGVAIISLFAVKNAVSFLLFAFENRFVYSIATGLSSRKVSEYYSSKFEDFQKSSTAELIREITYVPVEFAQHIILGSLTILSEGMILCLFVAAVAFYNVVVFGMTAATVLPFALLAWYLSSKLLKTTRTTIQKTSPANLNRLSDALLGYQEIRLYRRQQFFIDRYLAGQRSLNLQLGKLNTANVIPGRLSELFAVAGIIVILFVNYKSEGQLTASTLSLLTMYVAFAYRAIPSVNKILNAVVHMQTYSFSIDLIPAVEQASQATRSPGEEDAAPSLEFSTSIELRNISFSYPGRKSPILNDASFRIRKGEVVGLVGRSGLGKTTFLRILLQLQRQSSGEIALDGIPLSEEKMLSWHRLFSYVHQDSVILSDTIEANINFGTPKRNDESARIRRALEKSGLTEFISQLPFGLATHVGEQGRQLSGGQKQRLMIARALYRDASIFIFDEATSQLDSESEHAVIETISSLHREGKTIVIVSQGGQILRQCTKIYSLNRGKLLTRRKSSTTQEK